MTLTKDIIVGYRHGCAVRLRKIERTEGTAYAVLHKRGYGPLFKTLEEAKAYIKWTFNLEVE